MKDQKPISELEGVVRRLASYCTIISESKRLIPTELLLNLKRVIDSEVDLRLYALTRNRDGVEL
jgi:hypothetical protein